MPQPKSQSKSEASRRDQLSRVLDPLGLVVLTRERVLEAFEDAVQRGRMTRDDAQELATALINRSRQSTEELLTDLEQLFGRQRAGNGGGAATAPAKKDGAPKKRSAAKSTSSGGSRGAVPIAGYDDMTAAQITSKLGDLAPAQLRKVRDHERRNANRKSVLQAVERKLD